MVVSLIAIGEDAQQKIDEAKKHIQGLIKQPILEKSVIKFSKYHNSNNAGSSIA